MGNATPPRTFTTAERNLNWLQIDFGREIDSIKFVTVVKRRTDLAERFRNVEFRIGNTPVAAGFGLQDLSSVGNPTCGFVSGGNTDYVETVVCSSQLDGRYLTLQNTATAFLELDEIFIGVAS